MSQRNLLILIAATAVSYACYVRGAQNPFARYAATGFAAIEAESLQEVPNEDLFGGAMRGMVGVLHSRGDEHSQFIAEDDAKPLREELRQQFGGIGVRIRLAGEPAELTIVGPPEPGTPASRVDIRSGDSIVAIDGRATAGRSMAEILRMMRGRPGELIRLTIVHAAGEPPVAFELVREVITIDSILGDVRTAGGGWEFRLADEPRIGYVRITTFANRTAAELEHVLDELRAEGVGAVVLDLRDNAGGALDAAVAVCDLFLPPGLPIVETRGREEKLRSRYLTSGTGRYLDMPLVVLVNQNSASASEIVAACLQDHSRATIVGQRTYGKGTVQELIPIESGRSLLKLTTASYWRPSGENIHRMPGEPEEDSWGVSPNAGFEVAVGEKEYLAYRKYRSERDLPEQSPAAATVDAQSAAEATQFYDRQLLAAVEHLQQCLGD